jgi:hypothetical protein
MNTALIYSESVKIKNEKEEAEKREEKGKKTFKKDLEEGVRDMWLNAEYTKLFIKFLEDRCNEIFNEIVKISESADEHFRGKAKTLAIEAKTLRKVIDYAREGRY